MFRGIRRPELVFITGAGSGIGRATALRFARMGAAVISTDINAESARETARLIESDGGRAMAYRLDVTDRAAWTAMAEHVESLHGIPDVVVNNAGIVVIGGFLEQPKAAWDRQLAINFDGVINGCRAFAPLLARAGRGQIVNISSVMAFTPLPMVPSYNVAKAGVRMFSECLRGEMSEHGVGVSVVFPGAAATGIVAGEVVTDTGVNSDRVAGVQKLAAEYAQKYGHMVGFGPDTIAKGIVRAVRYNIGALPIRPEAWLMFAASRLSPGAWRFVLGQAKPMWVSNAAQVATSLIPERVFQAVDAVTDAQPDSALGALVDFVAELRSPSGPITVEEVQSV